jgi:hypothetical protein
MHYPASQLAQSGFAADRSRSDNYDCDYEYDAETIGDFYDRPRYEEQHARYEEHHYEDHHYEEQHYEEQHYEDRHYEDHDYEDLPCEGEAYYSQSQGENGLAYGDNITKFGAAKRSIHNRLEGSQRSSPCATGLKTRLDPRGGKYMDGISNTNSSQTQSSSHQNSSGSSSGDGSVYINRTRRGFAYGGTYGSGYGFKSRKQQQMYDINGGDGTLNYTNNEYKYNIKDHYKGYKGYRGHKKDKNALANANASNNTNASNVRATAPGSSERGASNDKMDAGATTSAATFAAATAGNARGPSAGKYNRQREDLSTIDGCYSTATVSTTAAGSNYELVSYAKSEGARAAAISPGVEPRGRNLRGDSSSQVQLPSPVFFARDPPKKSSRNDALPAL